MDQPMRVWYGRDTLRDHLCQMKWDTFHSIASSAAAIMQAESLLHRLGDPYDLTLRALARMQESAAQLTLPGPDQTDGSAVVEAAPASQPSNLIYFPTAARPRR